MTAVLEGQKIRQLALDHPEAVSRQIEVPDHLGIQQRDRVSGDRIAEPRMEFLGDRRPTHDRAPLEHRDLDAGGREVSGAHQSIVAAPDDDRVARRRITHERGGLRCCPSPAGAAVAAGVPA